MQSDFPSPVLQREPMIQRLKEEHFFYPQVKWPHPIQVDLETLRLGIRTQVGVWLLQRCGLRCERLT